MDNRRNNSSSTEEGRDFVREMAYIQHVLPVEVKCKSKERIFALITFACALNVAGIALLTLRERIKAKREEAKAIEAGKAKIKEEDKK